MLFAAFATSLALGLLFVPIIRRLALRFNLVAQPRKDRWHAKPTPAIGGVGIVLAFGISLLLIAFLRLEKITTWPLLLGAGIIFLVGLVDDFKRISPTAKLIGEIVAASIVVFFGRNIDFFPIEIANILFTFFWLVGITNAINLLDNMDGLAGGISLIAAGLLSYLFWKSGTYEMMAISLALAGSILGFLVFNFPPASIFMGDSGSLFLGFTLASLSIARTPQASNVLAVMGAPTLLFLLPILDTTLVTITRLMRGQSPAQGGKDHTSHRLIAFGLTERQAVLVLYGVAFISGVTGAFLESLNYTISLILIPVVLVSMALFTAYLSRLKVIQSDRLSHPAGRFTSLMVELTFRGRILEIALDFFIISIAYYLAFFIHFGSAVDIVNLDEFLTSLPVALGATYASFFIFGIYHVVWQYVGIRDLFRHAAAVFGGVLATACVVTWIAPPPGISLRIFPSFAAFLFLGLGISRSSFKILDQIYNQHVRGQGRETPVIILGADDAGVATLQWLLQDSSLRLKPVGFVDRDPFKQKRQITGIRVLGHIHELDMLLAKHRFEGILLPTESTLSTDELDNIREFCRANGIWLKRLSLQLEPLI